MHRVRITAVRYYVLGASVVAGVSLSTYLIRRKVQINNNVFAATTEQNQNLFPYGTLKKWNYNWDNRQPDYNDDQSVKVHGDVRLKSKPKANRAIILIRHGNYHTEGTTDQDRKLTSLGRQQAQFTGERLKKLLKLPIDAVYYSTMTRATETANIVDGYLTFKHLDSCSLLREGAPIRPEPPLSSYKPDDYQYKADHARIEAAFKKYFHRADVNQKEDSVDVIIGHANVIRYFVCRALQLPPEAWLRISIAHCSITKLVIRPSGRVILQGLGDVGHIPPQYISYS